MRPSLPLIRPILLGFALPLVALAAITAFAPAAPPAGRAVTETASGAVGGGPAREDPAPSAKCEREPCAPETPSSRGLDRR